MSRQRRTTPVLDTVKVLSDWLASASVDAVEHLTQQVRDSVRQSRHTLYSVTLPSISYLIGDSTTVHMKMRQQGFKPDLLLVNRRCMDWIEAWQRTHLEYALRPEDPWVITVVPKLGDQTLVYWPALDVYRTASAAVALDSAHVKIITVNEKSRALLMQHKAVGAMFWYGKDEKS